MDPKQHWEKVYQTKAPNGVSWYKPHLKVSLAWISEFAAPEDSEIIDIGGGASTLVDDLLNGNYRGIRVLDISGQALKTAKERLGPRADTVTWVEGDITQIELPVRLFDVWHDRAVFHFLTKPDEREKYVLRLNQSLKPDGTVIIGAFSLKGPERCSGLDIVRYSPEALQEELGEEYGLIKTLEESHETPFGTRQEFVYCAFKRQKGKPADN